jgi:hypothetical protein
VFRGSGPHLLAELSSGAAKCSSALDLASLLRWVPMLPCVPWLRALSPPRGELWHCHVFLSSGPRLPVEVGSGDAM